MPSLRWAFLLPTTMILLFLILGYTLDGPSGLRDHYNAEIANVPVLLAMSILYFLALLMVLNHPRAEERTVTVTRVRSR